MLNPGPLAGLAALTGCLAAANAQTPPSAVPQDVAGFCRMHPTMDHPAKAFFGASYTDEVIPDLVAATEATDWRCMGGGVFVCMNSADGDWCSKKNPSRTPSAGIEEFCADNPGSPYVVEALQSYSASAWRCDGRKAVIDQTWALDERGYMRKMWLPLVIRNGIAVSPHPDDFGTR
jgi:hypothetical protein